LLLSFLQILRIESHADDLPRMSLGSRLIRWSGWREPHRRPRRWGYCLITEVSQPEGGRMAKDSNTYAKRQRETLKRQKADAKRERRRKRKQQPGEPDSQGTSNDPC
jgi:hypothetical protein